MALGQCRNGVKFSRNLKKFYVEVVNEDLDQRDQPGKQKQPAEQSKKKKKKKKKFIASTLKEKGISH